MNYNYILFFEVYFGETLLKKDFKIIVQKKTELYFFWKYNLVKHFFVSTLVAN